MNLLGATLYDPAGAVSKATSSLLAMTAFDTTNLRLTVTVPAHGIVRVKMRCVLLGATTFPQILLGVMVGAAVKGRQAPEVTIDGTALATTFAAADSEFTVTGLTPGSTAFDAAYAVQAVVASTNIKYGGPDNNSGANAWGGFLFEIWDPQPLPVAIAPGATNGLLISGTNAGTTTLGAMTVTGAMTVSGGITVTQSSSNGSGVSITGNGTGHGLNVTSGSGATGNAINATSVSTAGNGIASLGSGTGNGMLLTGGAGANGDGLHCTAGGGTQIRANINGDLLGMVTGTMTEDYAALGAAMTIPQAIYEIRAILAQNSVSGTTVTTKKLNGSTTAHTYTINSSTTPTSITTAS